MLTRHCLCISALVSILGLSSTATASLRGFELQDTMLEGARGEVDGAVHIGSRRHVYEYVAPVADDLVVNLDFDAVQSARRGAEILVIDADGNWIAHEVNWPEPSVAIVASLPAAGTYSIYISHEDYWGFEYDTNYDYTVTYSLINHNGLCVILEVDNAEWPDWDLYITQNFDVADRAEAETYTSEFSQVPGFHLNERTIYEGFCGELVFDYCDATYPQVVGTDLQCNNFDNICEMKNYVHQWSGNTIDEYSAFQAYQLDGTCQNRS